MPQFQPPRGTRDFLPEEMLKRQFILDTARAVFERCGFDPLDTPAFEDFALLTAKSGPAIRDEIYFFKDKSDRELGLRFDFTVPLCRIAASTQLPKPFRRYQLGSVWRYDRPGAGRYREFCQADIDIIGAPGPEADTEVVACACEVLRKIGLSNFVVRVNNRKIISSFLESLGVDAVSIMRTVDKLNKIGEPAIVEELKGKGIEARKIKEITKFAKISDVKKASGLIKDEVGKEGIDELYVLVQNLNKLGYPTAVDMSMVRGLEYYTGNIFEINQKDNSLTITAGGRYDKMIEAFGGKPTPATGISLGVDRLLNFVQLDLGKTKVSVFIANVNAKEKCMEIAKELRDIGLNVEYDIMDRPLGKQLEYANSKGIRFSIVVGEKEMKSGVIKLRNMQSGKEKEIELRNLKRITDMIDSE
ncbi:MAG: histidine--tRNA ligase [Candidatus Aenigmarchaeota archaeon]|nr:histidine--tRNA ligase [Candidatus Aenigmarchaeota archaeon]